MGVAPPHVSAPYGQPYPDPRTAALHPASYQPYPPQPSAHFGGGAPYAGGMNQNPRHGSHGRGGHHRDADNRRPPFNKGGDRFQHKKPGHQGRDNNPQKADHSSAKKKKRKTNPNNILGLTPGGKDNSGDESDSDDDASIADEEARLLKVFGNNMIQYVSPVRLLYF